MKLIPKKLVAKRFGKEKGSNTESQKTSQHDSKGNKKGACDFTPRLRRYDCVRLLGDLLLHPCLPMRSRDLISASNRAALYGCVLIIAALNSDTIIWDDLFPRAPKAALAVVCKTFDSIEAA